MKQSLAEYLLRKLSDAVGNDLHSRPVPKFPSELHTWKELKEIQNEVVRALKG